MQTLPPRHNRPPRIPASPARTVVGLALLLPALLCCISQLLLPTVNTLLMSLQETNIFASEREYVGLQNYAALFGDDGFWRAAGFTLTILFVRLLVVSIVPLILAWGASQLRRPLRVGVRILFTLPVVFYVPVAIAITWLMFLSQAGGMDLFAGSWAASPASARYTLLFIDALYLSGIVGGLGLLVFMPLWRRSADAPPPRVRDVWKPMLAAWVVGMLGISALTLSTFTLSSVLTNGGPAGSTNTIGFLFYQLAFRNFDMGPAASVASLILLGTLLPGILAGLVIVRSHLRLDVSHRELQSEKTGPEASAKHRQPVAGAVAVGVALGIYICSALPFGWLLAQSFPGAGTADLIEQVAAGRVLLNTFLPALVTATLQILTAYLAALGIGALQPFGQRSGWLLLLFSPWLFVPILPLSLVNLLAAQQAGRLDTFLGSVPPVLLSVPALCILTIFFMARASHRTCEMESDHAPTVPNFFDHFLLPSLPLAGMLWLLLIFFNAQDILWPLLVRRNPETFTIHVTLLQLLRTFGGGSDMLATAVAIFVLPVSVFFFLCLIPFQVFTLDRLILYTEAPPAGWRGDAVPDPMDES